MRVLLDECVDWRLLRDLHRHGVQTVKQLGWEHLHDGDLLRQASSEFDVLITVDKALPHQQNIASIDIAVIVLRGRSTRLADLRELVDRVRDALASVRPHDVIVINWRDLQ